MDISPAQCRAARGLLDITQDQLAALSGISKRAIGNFEAGETRLMHANMQLLRATLERVGVEVIDGERPGVRLNDVTLAKMHHALRHKESAS